MPTSRMSIRLEDLLRELAPQVLGAVVRRSGDFAAAEDAVQEALLAAAPAVAGGRVRRTTEGMADPDRARRLIDEVRQRAGPAARGRSGAALRDLRRRTSRTATTRCSCCSCAATRRSPRPSQIALTLRAVGGLTTAEIAARLSGARGDHGAADQPGQAEDRRAAAFEPHAERPERLRTVLHVLYLMFNEGYTTSSGPSCSAATCPARRSG